MNALTTKAHKIAAEAGVPHNVESIARQLAFNANRAAIGRSLGYDRALASAASLPSDDRLALAIWLVDHLDHADPDARNEAVDVLGELVS